MDYIKKILRPKSIPFKSKKANQRYAEIMNFNEATENDKFAIKRIIQEIRSNSEIVVCAIDSDLTYTFIEKNGRIREFDLSKTKFLNKTINHFQECDENINEIIKEEVAKKGLLKENGVRLTFLTKNGNFSIHGTAYELSKMKMINLTLFHFVNLLNLTN